ncbi:MAG: 50S ribosomal protein L35 [Acidobacteriota bacterium]
MKAKLKTKRSAAKRFRLTGSGKVRRNHSHHSHILTKKSPKRKRNLRKTDLVAAADADRVRKMLRLK